MLWTSNKTNIIGLNFYNLIFALYYRHIFNCVQCTCMHDTQQGLNSIATEFGSRYVQKDLVGYVRNFLGATYDFCPFSRRLVCRFSIRNFQFQGTAYFVQENSCLQNCNKFHQHIESKVGTCIEYRQQCVCEKFGIIQHFFHGSYIGTTE